MQNNAPWPAHFTYRYGDLLQKKRGSTWRGKVVGWYSTELTPEGYAIASHFEPGNVQVYPVAALEPWGGQDDAG